jgi:hypothetical protein
MKKFFNKLTQNFPKDWPTRIILIVIVALSLVGAFFGYRLTRNIVSTNETFSLPGDPVIAATEEEADADATPAPTAAPEVALPTPEPWDGVSRVNILVMG